ncbi:hypothetical protein L2E82_06358 [Cichorium intybus]|uniref:Uncharacterized protein n=1 Tax=Cichorium intybus TaxID=13427 RepID=A0ACB9HAK3_CICIN|nr:hypothetical protein L2E82_06358 [Cichorium intybus]
MTTTQLVEKEPAIFIGSEIHMRDDDMPLAQFAVAFNGASWTDPDSIALMVIQAMLDHGTKVQELGNIWDVFFTFRLLIFVTPRTSFFNKSISFSVAYGFDAIRVSPVSLLARPLLISPISFNLKQPGLNTWVIGVCS